MPRKGENIYKRKDGRWEGRNIKLHSPSGKAIYGYVYDKTYRGSKEKLHAAIHANKENNTSKDQWNNCNFETIALE